MNAADGVHTIDSTELDFEQTVHAVVNLVKSVVAPVETTTKD
jgi:cytidylate kinase